MPMSSAAVVVGRSITDMIYATRRADGHGRLRARARLALARQPAEFAAAIGLLLLLRFALLWIGIFLGLLVPGARRR